ncbi:TolC family protein [Rhodoferax ferrireducens]|uniref:TolC family protein n=1 Tax=Rhodoferax ferrireducens TaxID=192843 RepID=UPI001E3AC3AD|nr:TolC family protein [Rhodoferax ferrireducens]
MVSISPRRALAAALLAALLAAPAVVLAADAPPIFAQTQAMPAVKPDAAPLTLLAALQMAVVQSRLIEAGSLQASAAREMVVAAGQLPDPVLKLGLNNLPINGEDRFSLTRDFMTMRSVGVMQEFTREGKRKARGMRFEKEAETAEANRALTLINVQRSTAVAWLDRYYQERMVDLLLRQRDETRLQIEAADAAYRGGRGSQSDVFAARSVLAQMEDRIAQAQAQVATAKAQLARWVGEVAAQRLADLPATDVLRLNESNLDAQLLHHPQVAVMAKQEEMARADVELAQASKQADWSVELMFSQRGPAYSNMVSLNVSVPLLWDQKNRQDRELAAKLATVAQLRAEREDAVRAHTAELRIMVQEWQSNRARLRRYDESILPLTTERTRAAIAAYRGGVATGGTLSAVLEARRTEVDMRMERLRLEMETARLWAQLNYLTPNASDAAASHP